MKKVTLHMNHTEAGVEHQAGETIELPDESADAVAAMVIQTRVAMLAAKDSESEKPLVTEVKVFDEPN